MLENKVGKCNVLQVLINVFFFKGVYLKEFFFFIVLFLKGLFFEFVVLFIFCVIGLQLIGIEWVLLGLSVDNLQVVFWYFCDFV